MPLLKTPLAKARERLAHADESLARWQAQLDAQRTTLAELEATMGADVLAAADDAEVDAIRERLLRVRTSIDVARAAVGSAEGAVVDARRAALTAAANEVRSRASDRRAEAVRHAARTRDLLDQLSEREQLHSDVEYRPVVFSELRGWDVVRTRSEILAGEADDLDGLASELTTAAQRPQLDGGAVHALLAKADPDGPEAAEARARHVADEERSAAARAFRVAVVAARKEWIAARTQQLVAAENGALSAVQAEGMANAELNAQRRRVQSGEAGELEGPVGPEQIDARALELLGVTIDRPAVAAGA